MYQRILVPTDGSRLSRVAIPHAAQLAAATSAALTLVAVVNAASEAVAHILMPVGLPAEGDEVRRELAEIAEELRSEGAPHVETLILEGEAGPTILEAARTTEADLIVMGTHGRSEAVRLLLGSVAETVVKHAPCPVLLVRENM